MSGLWLLLTLTACEVGSTAPATPGSPSAQEADAAQAIADKASEVDALAKALTAQVDESRRQVASGASTPEAEIEKMRGLMARIDALNAELQEETQALEARLHTHAKDPAWPLEPVEKRR